MWLDWSRKSHRGLRTWILLILKSEPKNGAEIMDSMEATSRGWWRPSPGSVYPMLQQLTEEGLVKRRESDGRYEVTPQGREEVEWPSRMEKGGARSVDGILQEISSYTSYLEDLSHTKDQKLTDYAPRLKDLGGRLSKLGETS
jgi:DNA-binding PadR family transcriptional regulator